MYGIQFRGAWLQITLSFCLEAFDIILSGHLYVPGDLLEIGSELKNGKTKRLLKQPKYEKPKIQG